MQTYTNSSHRNARFVFDSHSSIFTAMKRSHFDLYFHPPLPRSRVPSICLTLRVLCASPYPSNDDRLLVRHGSPRLLAYSAAIRLPQLAYFASNAVDCVVEMRCAAKELSFLCKRKETFVPYQLLTFKNGCGEKRENWAFGRLQIKAVFDTQREKFVSNTRPLKRNALSSQCNKNEMTSKQSNRMRYFCFLLLSLCRYGNFNANFKALQASVL